MFFSRWTMLKRSFRLFLLFEIGLPAYCIHLKVGPQRTRLSSSGCWCSRRWWRGISALHIFWKESTISVDFQVKQNRMWNRHHYRKMIKDLWKHWWHPILRRWRLMRRRMCLSNSMHHGVAIARLLFIVFSFFTWEVHLKYIFAPGRWMTVDGRERF